VDRVAPVVAVVAIGSNVGNRAAHLAYAETRLKTILSELRMSTIRETVPVGISGPQALFLNAVATGTASVSARALLERLLAIELERDRQRPYPNAPRTLDLDLVLFGDAVITEPDLIVPHPRFRERRFVLEPLAEVAPELRDPVTGLTASELLSRFEQRS
jgi:2-amino-4-hydroxy-6-hydroxymethyldihydropteridine diphosphokinase